MSNSNDYRKEKYKYKVKTKEKKTLYETKGLCVINTNIRVTYDMVGI
jgi:hypothetical protein